MLCRKSCVSDPSCVARDEGPLLRCLRSEHIDDIVIVLSRVRSPFV